MSKIVLVTLVLLAGSTWTTIAVLSTYNHWRDKVFKEGYDRGWEHTCIYAHNIGRWPDEGWLNKAWRFVGAVDQREWVEAVNGGPITLGRFREPCEEWMFQKDMQMPHGIKHMIKLPDVPPYFIDNQIEVKY